MAVYFTNKRVRTYKVGEIYFSTDYLNEVNIGDKKAFPNFKNSFNGKCTIEVFGDEGEYIPHFHIKSIDRKFSCCIYIFDNRFFEHGKNNDTLNKKDWKILDTWLRNINTKYQDKTNWETIVMIWDSIYYTDYSNKDTPQPDYTTIKPYKEN